MASTRSTGGRWLWSGTAALGVGARFDPFRELTEQTRFAHGVGLPGRVLAAGQPAWITDVTRDPNFPRASTAQEVGLKAAFAFPVLSQHECVAVLEFFSPQALEPDGALLELMGHIGLQLGRVVERKWGEQELARLSARLGGDEFAVLLVDADAAKAEKVADRLAKLGCRLALDDFGAGFGSFYYLKYLPLDYLKIDGDFISNLPRSPVDQRMVKAMVDLARALGMKTIAEFVGDEPTLALLPRLGVDYTQGFHIGRPAPIDELRADVDPEPDS